MTNPTPTPQTPPQGLTDEQLLGLATAASGYEMCGVFAIDRGNYYQCAGFQLIAAMRAAIAAHEAARPQPTPEEVEARFRTWIRKETGLVPSKTATTYAVAFALRLLAGEVAA